MKCVIRTHLGDWYNVKLMLDYEYTFFNGQKINYDYFNFVTNE